MTAARGRSIPRIDPHWKDWDKPRRPGPHLSLNLRWGETRSSPDFPAVQESRARRSLAPPGDGIMVPGYAQKRKDATHEPQNAFVDFQWFRHFRFMAPTHVRFLEVSALHEPFKLPSGWVSETRACCIRGNNAIRAPEGQRSSGEQCDPGPGGAAEFEGTMRSGPRRGSGD